MSEYAVILIDMLNDFVTGSLKCDRAQRIIPNLKRLVEAAHRNSVIVVYSNDAHYPQDHEVVARWAVTRLRARKGLRLFRS